MLYVLFSISVFFLFMVACDTTATVHVAAFVVENVVLDLLLPVYYWNCVTCLLCHFRPLSSLLCFSCSSSPTDNFCSTISVILIK
jgi:hypothetical protein